MAELRALLESRDVDSSGTKDALVSRLDACRAPVAPEDEDAPAPKKTKPAAPDAPSLASPPPPAPDARADPPAASHHAARLYVGFLGDNCDGDFVARLFAPHFTPASIHVPTSRRGDANVPRGFAFVDPPPDASPDAVASAVAALRESIRCPGAPRALVVAPREPPLRRFPSHDGSSSPVDREIFLFRARRFESRSAPHRRRTSPGRHGGDGDARVSSARVGSKHPNLRPARGGRRRTETRHGGIRDERRGRGGGARARGRHPVLRRWTPSRLAERRVGRGDRNRNRIKNRGRGDEDGRSSRGRGRGSGRDKGRERRGRGDGNARGGGGGGGGEGGYVGVHLAGLPPSASVSIAHAHLYRR